MDNLAEEISKKLEELTVDQTSSDVGPQSPEAQ